MFTSAGTRATPRSGSMTEQNKELVMDKKYEIWIEDYRKARATLSAALGERGTAGLGGMLR